MSTIAIEQSQAGIKPIPILIAFLIAGFVGLFSETALNMALGNLMIEFNVVSSTVQWITTGYLLTMGILIPVSALLIQWFSTRQLFVASLLFSIAGAIVSGMAPIFEVLLLGRVIQAIGTGLLIPLMFNTILIIFPIHKRGTIMGLVGLVMMSAPAIGPATAGLIIEVLSWNWILWLLIPFLAFSLVYGMLFMQNVSELTKPKIDVLSIFLSTLGFGGIVYGFSIAGHKGWGSPLADSWFDFSSCICGKAVQARSAYARFADFTVSCIYLSFAECLRHLHDYFIKHDSTAFIPTNWTWAIGTYGRSYTDARGRNKWHSVASRRPCL